MFILVTIFLPQGVLGLIEKIGSRRRPAREPAVRAEPEPAE